MPGRQFATSRVWTPEQILTQLSIEMIRPVASFRVTTRFLFEIRFRSTFRMSFAGLGKILMLVTSLISPTEERTSTITGTLSLEQIVSVLKICQS